MIALTSVILAALVLTACGGGGSAALLAEREAEVAADAAFAELVVAVERVDRARTAWEVWLDTDSELPDLSAAGSVAAMLEARRKWKIEARRRQGEYSARFQEFEEAMARSCMARKAHIAVVDKAYEELPLKVRQRYRALLPEVPELKCDASRPHTSGHAHS